MNREKTKIVYVSSKALLRVIVMLLTYILFGWLINRVINNPEKRIFLYTLSSSFIASCYIFNSGFAGNIVYVIEIPWFIFSGLIALYVFYSPIFLIKKLMSKQKLTN